MKQTKKFTLTNLSKVRKMNVVEYCKYLKLYILNFYLFLSSESPEILENAEFCLLERDLLIIGVAVGVSVISVCDLFRFLNLLVCTFPLAMTYIEHDSGADLSKHVGTSGCLNFLHQCKVHSLN